MRSFMANQQLVSEPRAVARALGTQSSRLLSLRTAHAQAVGTTAYPGPSLPLAVLTRHEAFTYNSILRFLSRDVMLVNAR